MTKRLKFGVSHTLYRPIFENVWKTTNKAIVLTNVTMDALNPDGKIVDVA